MSRAEDNSRSVSGMTLNDDRLSGERKRPLEPFVSVMGKPIPRKENRDKSQNYGLNFSDMDFLREFTGLSYQVMFTGIENST